MKIGDRIYVHGYVDEIRKDCVIVRNDGGYFGTVKSEIVEAQETEDIVSVIRCKDCKYKDDGIDEDGIPFLKCLNGRSYGGTRINDYCSWAERKEE